MHSSALGAAAWIILRSFWRAGRWWAVAVARCSSMVVAVLLSLVFMAAHLLTIDGVHSQQPVAAVAEDDRPFARESALPDFVHNRLVSPPLAIGLLSCSGERGADLLEGPSRPEILWAHKEHDAIDKLERMMQHEGFHLTVVRAAPIGAGEKRPADLDLAPDGVVACVARRADDHPRRAIEDGKCSARFQRLVEKLMEHILPVAIS